MISTGPMAVIVTADTALRDRLIGSLASHSILWTTCDSLDELEETASGHARGCIVLDARLGETDRIHKTIMQASAWMPIVLLCGQNELQTAISAMKFGASDVAELTVAPDSLLSKIHNAFSTDRAQKDDADARHEVCEHLSRLTERELEIAQLLSSGMSNKQMAARLGISIHTVANHRGNINAKLEAQNAADVIRMVIMHTCPATLRAVGKAGSVMPPCLCSHAAQSKCA
jgi:FixJ family two-component response regulator